MACTDQATCPSPGRVKSALLSAVLHVLSPSSFQLSVASAAPDPLVADLMKVGFTSCYTYCLNQRYLSLI